MDCNQKCPRCGVEITPQGSVLFSFGKPGSRARLFARVCQFALKRGATDCINQFNPETETIHELDYYGNF